MGYFSRSFSDLHVAGQKMFYYDILFRSQTSIGYSISRLFKHASIVEFGSVILAIVSLFKRYTMLKVLSWSLFFQLNVVTSVS